MGHAIDKTWPRCGVSTHRGGCECGAVRYQLQIDGCSDDIALAPSVLMVRAREFQLLSGEDCLSGHQFASCEVHHFYCEQCGVRSFTRHNIAQKARSSTLSTFAAWTGRGASRG